MAPGLVAVVEPEVAEEGVAVVQAEAVEEVRRRDPVSLERKSGPSQPWLSRLPIGRLPYVRPSFGEAPGPLAAADLL